MARRYSRGMALRPINRIKHVVDSNSTLGKATDLTIVLAQATDTPTLAVTNSVETGSKINGFYIRLEVASNDPIDVGAIPNVYMYVWKNTANDLVPTNPNSTGDSDLKRLIIHQEMSMIENKGQGSNPRTLFNGVVVVPKGMRRMGPSDSWNVVVRGNVLDLAVCLQCHYKESR